MPTYIGLVRGINVGPTTRVSMADFRAVFENLGHEKVKTLLQSGNVVFDAQKSLNLGDVEAIEREFFRLSGFSAGFVVHDSAEFLDIASQNPLSDIADDPSKLIIVFLPKEPDAATLVMPDPSVLEPEVLRIGSKAIYLWCANGVSTSKVPVSFWKQLGPVYTARNVNTVNKLATIVRERL